MKKELLQHKIAYAILAIVLLILMALFLLVWPNRMVQRLIALAIAGFYILWGVTTHLHTDHLSRRVIAEYAAVASLAAALLLIVTI